MEHYYIYNASFKNPDYTLGVIQFRFPSIVMKGYSCFQFKPQQPTSCEIGGTTDLHVPIITPSRECQVVMVDQQREVFVLVLASIFVTSWKREGDLQGGTQIPTSLIHYYIAIIFQLAILESFIKVLRGRGMVSERDQKKHELQGRWEIQLLPYQSLVGVFPWLTFNETEIECTRQISVAFLQLSSAFIGLPSVPLSNWTIILHHREPDQRHNREHQIKGTQA